MNWRWLMFDYADPDLPLTLWERIKVAWRPIPIWKLPHSARRGRLLSVRAIMPVCFVTILSMTLLISWIGPNLYGLRLLLLFLLLAIPGSWIGCCLVFGVVGRSEYIHRLRLEGFDVCLKCGYWLKGLSEDVKQCPECGWRREGEG